MKAIDRYIPIAVVSANEEKLTMLLFVRSIMTSSNVNTFRVTGPLCREITGHRSKWPVTRSFDGFFELRLNHWLSKQLIRRRFERTSRSLWRHCNVHRNNIVILFNDDAVIRHTTKYWRCMSGCVTVLIYSMYISPVNDNVPGCYIRFTRPMD